MTALRQFVPQPATARISPLQIALVGYTRSGKTYGALLLARGIAGPNGKIGIIDTEGGRGRRYVGRPEIGDYEYIGFDPPFGPLAYVEAIQAANAAKWDVIIIDSASHAWDGEGGALDIASDEEDRLGRSAKSHGALWKKPKLEHARFIREATERCSAHVIACFRTAPKTDFTKEGAPVVYEIISEKTAAFQFEFQGWLESETNLCKWRAPISFLDILPPGKLTPEMGAAMVARNSGQSEEEGPEAPILFLMKESGITDRELAECLRLLGISVDRDAWLELPSKTLAGIAKPARWAKILDTLKKVRAAA